MTVIGYHQERSHWKEFDTKVSNAQAELIVKKLAKHFKLTIRYTEFYGYRDSGQASKWRGRIRLSNAPSIGVICHEVNHFLCWKKFNKVRHGTKRWCRQLQIIINYVQKKNCWIDEFKRRTAPKLIKPEPTKKELRLQRVKLLEERKQRYEKKIRLAENRIKKINRQIAGLKRFL